MTQAGALAKRAEAVAQVLRERRAPSACRGRRGTASLTCSAPPLSSARLAAGLRRRQPGGDQRLRPALEMILQLALEIAIERGAAAEASEPGHGRPPSGRRIRPIAAVSRSQLAVPVSSWAWPCFVSL